MQNLDEASGAHQRGTQLDAFTMKLEIMEAR